VNYYEKSFKLRKYFDIIIMKIKTGGASGADY